MTFPPEVFFIGGGGGSLPDGGDFTLITMPTAGATGRTFAIHTWKKWTDHYIIERRSTGEVVTPPSYFPGELGVGLSGTSQISSRRRAWFQPSGVYHKTGESINIGRPDERGGGGGGQGGPAPRGPGVWGAREESKNTVVGQAGFFFFFDRKSVHGGSRILIRGGPPKKNVGLATLGMM